LLQHRLIDSEGEIPDSDLERALTEPEAPYSVSGTVARFVDRLASLSTAEWESIQTTIKKGGVEISMVDASRNAAVALAVRDLISTTQFDQLYRPFRSVIPLESLEASRNLD
jgi:pyruvate/2-oxoglutarate/acetoin dehydrogenase E1 component